MKKCAAIVVTYNRKKLLLENIKCLLEQKQVKPDILIIDNHSTDGTAEALRTYIDQNLIKYFDTGANLGGAGGFQYGIRKAVELDYDYLWIMDDDCMPTPSALQYLLDADKELKGNYGFLSSKVLWKDRTLCTMNVQRRTLFQNITSFDTDYVPVVMASFVSLFMKKETVEKIGLPIKEFFIWTDDWEYTRRISRLFPCYVATRSEVIHKSTSNIGADISTDSLERLDRYRYLYRNDVYLYRREGFKGFCYECVRLSAHMMRVLLKSKNNRFKRLKMIMSGTVEGLFFKPEVEFVKEKFK